MPRRALQSLALLSLALPTPAQGDLSSVRDAVRGSSSQESAVSPGTYLGDDEEDGSDFWFEALFVDLFEQALLSPFTLPRLLLEDPGDTPLGFRPRPDHTGPGYWCVPLSEDRVQRLSTRTWFELGRDFDDLERVGLGLRVEHATRFGLELDWSRFREDLGPLGTDELDLGLALLTYRFAQSPRAAFRAGIGLDWIDDRSGRDAGVLLRYGAELLPVRHVTMGVDADWGTLGSADTGHLRWALGFELEGYELFAAYDAWDVGGADLQTWALGLRAWL